MIINSNITIKRILTGLLIITSLTLAGDNFVKNQFLIKLIPGSIESRVRGIDGKWELGLSDIDGLANNYNIQTIFKLFPGELNNEDALLYIVLFEEEIDEIESIALEFERLNNVETVELIYVIEHEALQWGQYPVDDPYYNTELPNWDNTYNRDFEQWWLLNDGDPISNGYNYPSQYNSSATAGMDISVEEAWDMQEGRDDVIIAIWDSGIAYQHEDLRDKMWVNRFEDSNGDGQFNVVIINRYTQEEDPEGHVHQLRWNYCTGMFANPDDFYFNGDRGDASCDWAPGLLDVDDDGDGFIDFNDPDVYGILTDGVDSDNDGTIEDEPGGLLDDSPGTIGVDDDGDGIIDDYDGAIFDDDENGYIDDVHGYYFDLSGANQPIYRCDVYDPRQDINGAHGSSMAGAAAKTNNSKGIAGVCKNCIVMSIGRPWGSTQLVMKKQLNYVMNNGWQSTPEGQPIKQRGVHIINMSWGSPHDQTNYFLDNKFEEAFNDSNIVLIAAAGNNKNHNVYVPANRPTVIAVAGLEPDGKRADLSDNGGQSFKGSTIGQEVEICGPYAPIAIVNPLDEEAESWVPEEPDQHYRWNTRMSWYYSGWVGGTSGAAATVSGVAGLIISELYDNGIYNYSSQIVRDIIRNSGVNVDAINPGLQGLLGNGMINANEALLITQYLLENNITTIRVGELSGDITENTLITGNVFIMGDFNIPNDVSLHIWPGTTVNLDYGVILTIEGSFIAKGTDDKQIFIIGGESIESKNGNFELSHVTVDVPFSILLESTTGTANQCKFTTVNAMVINGGNFTFNNCTFNSWLEGVVVSSLPNEPRIGINFNNCIFENSSYGLFTSYRAMPNIKGCIFRNNSIGIFSESFSEPVLFHEETVTPCEGDNNSIINNEIGFFIREDSQPWIGIQWELNNYFEGHNRIYNTSDIQNRSWHQRPIYAQVNNWHMGENCFDFDPNNNVDPVIWEPNVHELYYSGEVDIGFGDIDVLREEAAGNYSEASAIYHQIISDNPNSKRALWALAGVARCYEKTGMIQELIDLFESYVSDYPDTEIEKYAHSYGITSQIVKGDYPKALTMIASFNSSYPNSEFEPKIAYESAILAELMDQQGSARMTVENSQSISGLPDKNDQYAFLAEHYPETGFGVIAALKMKSNKKNQEETPKFPEEYSLLAVYPNPFNPTTTIRFNLVETQLIASLRIYDITGRLVETLINESLEPGTHEFQWNAKRQSSGIYFVELTSGKKRHVQKVVFMK